MLRLLCRYPLFRWSVPSFEKEREDGRGPLGAQYCPVLLISSFSVHSIKLFAASSGVTAISTISSLLPIHPMPKPKITKGKNSPPPSSQYLSNPTPFVISVLINPGCTIPTTTPASFKSKLNNFPTIFSALLLA